MRRTLLGCLLALLLWPGMGWGANRSDNFNRADTTTAIGTPSDGGSAWVQLSGSWGISTNRGYNSTGGSHQSCVLEASSSVVTVEVTFETIATETALILRAVDDSNYVVAIADTVSYNLYKRVAGGFTLIGSNATTFASGDVFKISVDSANQYIASKNGTPFSTLSDAVHATATQHGLRVSGGTTARFENFSITDNAVTGNKSLLLLGVGL